MGLVDEMRQAVRKSGANKGKFVYFKAGAKVRVRFLQELDDGMKITFHDSYSAGINVPCQETFDRKCQFCDDDELRTRDQYLWCVWDYDAKEVRIIMAAVNNCSPVPALLGMSDSYGTIMDRDYEITKNGTQTTTTFQVIPLDKSTFKNKAAKPIPEKKILAMVDKAFPADSDDDDEDEDEHKKKSSRSKQQKRKPAAKNHSRDEDEDEDDEVEEDEDEEEDESEGDYDDMTPQELFKECKSRGLKVKPKMKAKYYIQLLEKDDKDIAEDDDEDEDEDEDEWDE